MHNKYKASHCGETKTDEKVKVKCRVQKTNKEKKTNTIKSRK
jgi:hypothetical protein